MVLIASGFVTGLLGGGLGIGGGVVLVPLLMMMGRDWAQACALSLFCILVSSLVVSAKALPQGEVDGEEAAYIEGWGCCGGYLGYLLISHIQGWGLMSLLAVLLTAFTCYSMWKVMTTLRPPAGRDTESLTASHLTSRTWAHRPALRAGVYSFVGLASGILGIGGGALLVPWLHYVQRFSWPRASATSSYALGGLSAGALMGYLGGGHLPWEAAPWAAAGVLMGSYAGVQARRYAPPGILQTCLTLILVGVTVMVWRSILS